MQIAFLACAFLMFGVFFKLGALSVVVHFFRIFLIAAAVVVLLLLSMLVGRPALHALKRLHATST